VYEFKSKETKNELFMSFKAFKIRTDEPPLATPISKHFFGLNFLIIPLMFKLFFEACYKGLFF
jgi:hypothetical protein